MKEPEPTCRGRVGDKNEGVAVAGEGSDVGAPTDATAGGFAAADGLDRSPGDNSPDPVASSPKKSPSPGATDEDGPSSSSGGQETKERPADADIPRDSIGAVQVDDQAPQLNRLFFRNRKSLMARRAARLADRRTGQDEERETGRRNSTRKASERLQAVFSFRVRRSQLVEAELVEDAQVEVVQAEPVGLVERKWKAFASAAVAFVLALLAVAISVFLVNRGDQAETGAAVSPSLSPTLAPTFDPRPTLEIVRDRGHIRCGLFSEMVASEGFHFDLCRSIAAVVVGSPDRFEGVTTTADGDPLTYSNRWKHLQDRSVDVLILGDTHTVEREVRESSTGSGFTFSTPYKYDGMAYFGNKTFVRCAEGYKRYKECSELSICVVGGTSDVATLEAAFPSDYIKAVPSLGDIPGMLSGDECNVGAALLSQGMALKADGALDERFVVGERLITKEPLAVVSRNTDREFSDAVNWVVQALFYGEAHGLSRNASLCRIRPQMTSVDASKLDYLNGVFCVGNYAEIADGDAANSGINSINGGTGMIYAIPFRNIDSEAIAEPANSSPTLEKIKKGLLTCGVVFPDNFEDDVFESDELIGMSVDYCHTLSAAIFIGDPERVNFFAFKESDNSSVPALANGTLDVLVGGRNKWEFDFESSPSLDGIHFSTPYFFGNESASDDVSFYSITTREGDLMFTSFVNCVVLSTIYAQEHDIKKEKSREMPMVHLFGSQFRWALRDAISYSGSYDDLYKKHFSNGLASRGRNTLNIGGPMMLSFIHLSRPE